MSRRGTGSLPLLLLALPLLHAYQPSDSAHERALAADDECSAADERCALSALQLRAKAAGGASRDAVDQLAASKWLRPHQPLKRLEEVDEDESTTPPPPVFFPCYPPENTTCPGDATCVQSDDGQWAQCIDCKNRKLFRRDCVKWDDHLRLAAIKECGLVCPDSRCYSEDWCPGRDWHCALQADSGWGQCFPCTKAYYKDHCAGWSQELWKAAKKVCRLDCPAQKEAEKWRKSHERMKKKQQQQTRKSPSDNDDDDDDASVKDADNDQEDD